MISHYNIPLSIGRWNASWESAIHPPRIWIPMIFPSLNHHKSPFESPNSNPAFSWPLPKDLQDLQGAIAPGPRLNLYKNHGFWLVFPIKYRPFRGKFANILCEFCEYYILLLADLFDDFGVRLFRWFWGLLWLNWLLICFTNRVHYNNIL